MNREDYQKVKQIFQSALDVAPDLPAAMAMFRAARIERVENVRTQTILQGEIIQATDPDATGLAGSPSQNVQLFDYDPTTVPLHV